MKKELYEANTARLPLRQLGRLQIEKEEFIYPRSKDKKDIIDWFVFNQFIDNYVRKLAYDIDVDIVDDMIQDIYVDLCSWPQSKFDRLTDQGYGALRAYMSGVISRQVHSASSTIYHRYKKHQEKEIRLSDENWKAYEEYNYLPNSSNWEGSDSSASSYE